MYETLYILHVFHTAELTLANATILDNPLPPWMKYNELQV